MSNVTTEVQPDMFNINAHWFTILIFVFTTLVGVPGNALVLWVTGVKMKWTMTTIWFWNLALADMICCLSIPLSVAQFFYPDWLYGPILCKILPFVVPLNMFASVFTLVTISIDRCILVVIPIWARTNRRVKIAWLVCLAIWMSAFLMCLPKIIYRTYETFDNRTLCLAEEHDFEATTYVHMVFGFILPFVIICGCYIYVAFTLRDTRHVEAGKKITKLAFGVIVAFFITWAPYHIMSVVLQFIEHDVLDFFSEALAQFNSCINPILYVLMGKEMKHKLRLSILDLMQNVLSESVSKTPSQSKDVQMTSESGSLQ